MRRNREMVLVRRKVQVERVPHGSPVELEEGTCAEVTQALGSSFTLMVEGQLVRLRGEDADAIGKSPPTMPSAQHKDDIQDDAIEPLVWETLRTCYDPEIPVNMVDLGLVYRCVIEPLAEEPGKLRVIIDMTLTAPGCGMGEILANEVHEKILSLPRVEECTVNLVFDPPWDQSRMSEGALLSLGL